MVVLAGVHEQTTPIKTIAANGEIANLILFIMLHFHGVISTSRAEACAGQGHISIVILAS
jgi:hypothetical protein